MIEVLKAIYDVYVTCPYCEEVFRVNEGNPRTTKKYRPSVIEKHEIEMIKLDEKWRKKVDQARTHQRTIGVGSVIEKIAPIIPNYPLNPKDARYIGGIAPVDIMSLNGYSEDELESITFLEIKTGKRATLARMERNFRDVVKSGSVSYDILHYPVERILEYMQGAPIIHKTSRAG